MIKDFPNHLLISAHIPQKYALSSLSLPLYIRYCRLSIRLRFMLMQESPIVFLCISSVWTNQLIFSDKSDSFSLLNLDYVLTGSLFKSKTHSFIFLYLTLTTVTACILFFFYCVYYHPLLPGINNICFISSKAVIHEPLIVLKNKILQP